MRSITLQSETYMDCKVHQSPSTGIWNVSFLSMARRFGEGEIVNQVRGMKYTPIEGGDKGRCLCVQYEIQQPSTIILRHVYGFNSSLKQQSVSIKPNLYV